MNMQNNKPQTKTPQRQFVRDANSVKNQTESSGIRFASSDSVKSASSWTISKYAKALNKLAQ
jgi:hypothetical protein